MPKEIQRPYWMQELQTEALDEIFSKLTNDFADILSNTTPITITQEEIHASNEEDYAQILCEQLKQKAKLNLNIKTYFTDDSNPVFSNTASGITPQSSNDSEITLFIKDSLINDAPKLLAEMAHAIARAALETNLKMKTVDPLEKEAIADILAILLGYGIIICNTREWKQENICSCGLWHSKVYIGFISVEAACYIQGKMTLHYGEKFSAYKKYLRPTPKQFIKQSIKYLKKIQK